MNNEDLILKTMPLAERLAARYVRPGIRLDDLKGEALLALCRAGARFDATRGPFDAFARATIESALKRFVFGAPLVRAPERARRAAGRLRNLGLEDQDIARELNIAPAELKAMDSATYPPRQLDSIPDKSHPADPGPGPEEQLMRSEFFAGIAAALDRLTPLERATLTLRYSLDNGGRRTRLEVSAALGITPGKVAKVESLALKKLKHPSMYLQEWTGCFGLKPGKPRTISGGGYKDGHNR